MKKTVFLLLTMLSLQLRAARILIPMDETQKNHLKSYGIAFWVINKQKIEVEWLLNYLGGSFMISQTLDIENECKIRGISYDIITEAEANSIEATISNPEVNMEIVKLLTAPKIAVYSPKTKQPAVG